MTLSLAAVFIPILFMSGILGRLFREFAVTITTAIMISGLVSITLTPMLCSRFLTLARPEDEGRISRWLERQFNRLRHTYEVTLGWTLRHRPVTQARGCMLARRGGVLHWHKLLTLKPMVASSGRSTRRRARQLQTPTVVNQERT